MSGSYEHCSGCIACPAAFHLPTRTYIRKHRDTCASYYVGMGTAATVWVPLVTAGVGLVAGIGATISAAILTQRRTDRREDVRWEREQADRKDQWQRERNDRLEQWKREDSLRW